MSASVVSYESMLGGMWAPEGSEISERLKRLHELEQMRKEREAKRQEAMKNKGGGTAATIGVVRSARVQSSNVDKEPSSGIGIRRALSLREDSENFGGARPKMGGLSGNVSEDTGFGGGTLFSEIKASLLGPRKPLRGGNEYESRSRFGSTDSDSSTTSSNYSRTYTLPTATDRSYTRSFSSNQENGTDGSLFSGITSSVLGDKQQTQWQPYSSRSRYEQDRVRNEDDGYEYSQYDNGYHEIDGHSENNEDDHGEEPKQFIERLKYGQSNAFNSNGRNENGNLVQSMPVVPPLENRETEDEAQTNQMPDLVQPNDDILSLAHEISTTFGQNSPVKFQADKVFDSSQLGVNPKESVTYEIHEVNYDSSGDEEGKMLPVRESFYNARPSEWGIVGKTPGRLDQMQEYFTGESAGEDPNISRELDGGTVKAELEKSFSEKEEKKRVSDRSNGRKTPTKIKKTAKKENPVKRSKSPLDKLKTSSGSEHDSVPTSESELESGGLKRPTPRRKIVQNTNAVRPEEKNGMSLSDKLAKLESLTQEKQLKQSVGENDVKKVVPSYMSGTNSSNRKRTRSKEQSPGPSRDLKRDVREIKQFVHENSEPNTPISTPVKSLTETFASKSVEKATKNICVQTEFVLDFPDVNYVCKHCGKSSFDEIKSPLTEDNIKKTFENFNQDSNQSKDAVKQFDTKFSSKDSVKSLGEASTKSEKTFRYKPKAASGTQSYMKGTTASRLKNNSQTSDAKGRKGSAPEIMHRAEQEAIKGPSSLRGNVSDKLKAIEKANKTEKSKPVLSLYRGRSVERDKPEIAAKPKLSKSKSVDQVAILNAESQLSENTVSTKDMDKPGKPKSVEHASREGGCAPSSPSVKKVQAQAQQPLSPKPCKSPVEKLDLSSLVSPLSPRSPWSTVRKTPPASPRTKAISTEISPRSVTSQQNETDRNGSEEHFTTLEDNPFIKNDVRRSFKSKDKEESVWEKVSNRSRDSSLNRSVSAREHDRERCGSSSSLKRHNSSAGEKSSVSELTWSDSGSTGSLRGSKSSLHGSNPSLNRSEDTTEKIKSLSDAYTNNISSQNRNISPVGPAHHPISAAVETDIDAAYNEKVREAKTVKKKEEHNEETVNKAHLEFAKKAGDILELEVKKRNQNDDAKIKSGHENGLDTNQNETVSKKENGLQSTANDSVKVNGTENIKKQKGKRGFFKINSKK